MNKKKYMLILILIFLFGAVVGFFLQSGKDTSQKMEKQEGMTEEPAEKEESAENPVKSIEEEPVEQMEVEGEAEEKDPVVPEVPEDMVISWNPDWEYASYSQIHASQVTLYYSHAAERKNFVVGLNAGHGTSGGSSVRTSCHPDGTPKVTGGSTASGSTTATAISEGTTFLDGTPEAVATLNLAKVLKEELLEAGFDVLMIRETDDCQLDNIARTVFANQCADCHIALHYDSSENDKGFFYISVPEIESYRSMEPVASHWQEHQALGEALLVGARQQSIPLFQNGNMALDLTQTSYSTVPSVDVEVGDRASDRSPETLKNISQAIVIGLNEFAK